VKYAQIPLRENDSDAHRAFSLKAARESIVLLKNDANVLPLKKGLKNIAVIGPNADDKEVLLGNYNGEPSVTTTPLQGIRNKLPNSTVTYSEGMYATGETFEPVSSNAFPGGLKAEYFNNQELRGPAAAVRTDARIDFNWGRYKPVPELSENNFSVRWTGKLKVPQSATYTLGFTADDGARLYVDGKLLVDAWASNPAKTVTKEIALEAGRSYDVRMEYFQNNREAVAKLEGRSAEAFALRYFEGYDNGRIAEILGTTQMVVAVTLHRARTRLRKEISSYLEKHHEAQ
jgi:beta-glucosidase